MIVRINLKCHRQCHVILGDIRKIEVDYRLGIMQFIECSEFTWRFELKEIKKIKILKY